MTLRKAARKFINGEEMRMYSKSALQRFEGLQMQFDARDMAEAAGYTKEQLLDEVAQIDAEDDSK